jgi:UDP-N-acetylmuramate: L-alanyl-gamma-D-glutamyl-meso-diaminopimelate ligase
LKQGVLKDALPESFAQADQVHVYSAGLDWDAGAVFGRLGQRARCDADLGSLVRGIVAEARAGDLVLVMSNGGFGGIHDKLLSALGTV